MFPPSGSIRAVLFDAVGTLMRPEPGVAEAYLAAAQRHGVAADLTADDVSRRFRVAFARQEALDRAANWTTSEDRERQRWQTIVGEVFGPAAEETPLFDTLWRRFADARAWRLFDDVPPVLSRLQTSGALVGIASNFDARLRGLLKSLPPVCPDSHVFISSEIGHRKPSVRFFRAVEAALGLAPPQMLLVGDDRDNDYHAAQAAGWHALFVDRTRGNLDLEPLLATG